MKRLEHCTGSTYLGLALPQRCGLSHLLSCHSHQAAQDAHTHGSAEAYDPPIVWANRARPMPWEKADPDRVPEVGLLGKREGVLRG